jgi:hypothetical protein
MRLSQKVFYTRRQAKLSIFPNIFLHKNKQEKQEPPPGGGQHSTFFIYSKSKQIKGLNKSLKRKL